MRRAFSVTELLIVMVIITIVVGLLLPALAGARNASRSAATQSLMTDLLNAADRFRQDEQRHPGYFSARNMGDPANATQGLTAMENALLDLAGGIMDSSEALSMTDSDVAASISPTGDDPVNVRLSLVGSESAGGGYFSPPAKYYIVQGEGSQESTPGPRALPDLVDAFGTPILVWTRTPGIEPLVEGTTSYLAAQDTSDTDVDGDAAFYWASNAGFLNSTGLGQLAFDQTQLSLLGSGQPKADRVASMRGILGSPALPDRASYDAAGPDYDTAADLAQILPASPRGSFVLHTAGMDGVYLAKKQSSRAIPPDAASADALEFGYSFFRGKTNDFSEIFDDMVMGSP